MSKPIRSPGHRTSRRTASTRPPRSNANARGYTYRWQQRRVAYLADHPLCIECERRGRTTPANIVDHVVPHRGDDELFWDEDNWQALCERCHNEKTGRGE